MGGPAELVSRRDESGAGGDRDGSNGYGRGRGRHRVIRTLLQLHRSPGISELLAPLVLNLLLKEARVQAGCSR